MNGYLVIIVGSLVAAWLVNALAGVLSLRSFAPEVPAAFADVYDAAAYARSQRYAAARTRVSLVEDGFGTAVVLAFILLGGFGALDGWARALAGGLGELAVGLAFIGALMVLSDVAGLPFAVYRTFVLEARFGFNRTTVGTFVADKVKGYVLAACIGGPVVAGVLYFFQTLGGLAWVCVWALVVAVSLVMMYVAPVFILPLFNTFTPMEEGGLRQALEAYATGQGFALSGIFSVDGSRRSAKANAYFTGFGKTRRIALFDTLIERLTTGQLVSVLAHEVGHCVRGHIVKGLVLLTAKTGVLFFLMSLFLGNRTLFDAFGVREISVHAGLVFFGLLYTPVSLALSVATNALSRAWEYEADAFAARTTGEPEHMVAALKQLSVSNLSNLTPHPLEVALHHSHPPVLARIEALRRATAP
ncbi:MAG: M48 family metallopeptidase [Desulfovibrionaceae bacterium]